MSGIKEGEAEHHAYTSRKWTGQNSSLNKFYRNLKPSILRQLSGFTKGITFCYICLLENALSQFGVTTNIACEVAKNEILSEGY